MRGRHWISVGRAHTARNLPFPPTERIPVSADQREPTGALGQYGNALLAIALDDTHVPARTTTGERNLVIVDCDVPVGVHLMITYPLDRAVTVDRLFTFQLSTAPFRMAQSDRSTLLL